MKLLTSHLSNSPGGDTELKAFQMRKQPPRYLLSDLVNRIELNKREERNTFFMILILELIVGMVASIMTTITNQKSQIDVDNDTANILSYN